MVTMETASFRELPGLSRGTELLPEFFVKNLLVPIPLIPGNAEDVPVQDLVRFNFQIIRFFRFLMCLSRNKSSRSRS